MTDKISEDMAEKEFDRFVESMGLDVDVSSMDDDDQKGFQAQKRPLIMAIKRGSLIINDNGEPVYTTTRDADSKTITFYEPTGSTLIAMDRRKKNEDIAKSFAIMADMTKTDSKTFSSMKISDLKVCQAVMALFLG